MTIQELSKHLLEDTPISKGAQHQQVNTRKMVSPLNIQFTSVSSFGLQQTVVDPPSIAFLLALLYVATSNNQMTPRIVARSLKHVLEEARQEQPSPIILVAGLSKKKQQPPSPTSNLLAIEHRLQHLD